MATRARPSGLEYAKVRYDQSYMFRYYDPTPQLDVRDLPEHVEIIMPPDGGFWLADKRNGVRYRRITMDDLPKNVTWNTRGKVQQDDGE